MGKAVDTRSDSVGQGLGLIPAMAKLFLHFSRKYLKKIFSFFM